MQEQDLIFVCEKKKIKIPLSHMRNKTREIVYFTK